MNFNQMFSWIKDNIGTKNLFILSLVILVIAGFMQGPSLYKKYKKSQYDGPVLALVTNVIPKEDRIQHFTGSNTVVVGYYISYIYNVQAREFSNTEYVLSDYDNALLYSQFCKGMPLRIEIKYSGELPSDCYISNLVTGAKK